MLVGHRTGRLVARTRSVGPEASDRQTRLSSRTEDSWAGFRLGIEPTPVSTGPYNVAVIGAGAVNTQRNVSSTCTMYRKVVIEGQSLAGGRVQPAIATWTSALHIRMVSSDNALVLLTDCLDVKTRGSGWRTEKCICDRMHPKHAPFPCPVGLVTRRSTHVRTTNEHLPA